MHAWGHAHTQCMASYLVDAFIGVIQPLRRRGAPGAHARRKTWVHGGKRGRRRGDGAGADAGRPKRGAAGGAGVLMHDLWHRGCRRSRLVVIQVLRLPRFIPARGVLATLAENAVQVTHDVGLLHSSAVLRTCLRVTARLAGRTSR